MKCELIIKDPTLKYFLGKDKFKSYSDFRKRFESKVNQGLIPIGNELKSVLMSTQGYSVGEVTFDNLDSLVESALSGLIEENNAEIQFSRFLQSFEIYKTKYQTEEYISNEDKERDIDFLKTILDFYENFPVNQDFVESKLYSDFLQSSKELRDFLTRINQEQLDDPEPAFDTNESTSSDNEEEPYYYSVARVYEPGTDDVSQNKDELAILRHNFSNTIQQLMDSGRKFFIRLEPDSALNAQTISEDEISQKNIKWGVVGVVYELVGNEFKRVYIKSYSKKINSDVEITHRPEEAVEVGKNKVKGFSLTIPDMSKDMYSNVNENVRIKFIELRENAIKEPSGYFPITGSWKELPVAGKFDQSKGKVIPVEKRIISLRNFLAPRKGALRIATEQDKIIYAGNLFVQFPEAKVALNRTALNEKWQDVIFNLVNHDYQGEDIDSVVKSLNTLLDFKGGDIFFVKRGNRIIAFRKSKREKIDNTYVYTRKKEEVPLNELRELLTYARINVNKEWLENPDGTFPIITDKGLQTLRVNWEEFYMDHHDTIARQVKIGNEYYFGPITSLVFEPVETTIDSKNVQKIGDIEINESEEYDVIEILNRLNPDDPDIKNIVDILKLLLQNEEVKSRLEGSTIKFDSSLDNPGMSDGKEIFVHPTILKDKNFTSDVIAHELIHTLTSDWMIANSDHPLVKELESLLELIPEEVFNRGKYEILSALSNPEIVAELKKIKVDKKSLFDKLVDLIKDIIDKVFGLSKFKQDASLYKELVVKLVQIATEKPSPKPNPNPDFWEGIDLNSTGPSIFRYTEPEEYFPNEDKSFLNKVVDSIDAEVFQKIYEFNFLGKFVSGELDFEIVISSIIEDYKSYVSKNRDSLTPDEVRFYKFVLKNQADIIAYWQKKTNAVKIKKSKKKKDVEDVGDVDVSDEDEKTIFEIKEEIDEKEEKEEKEISDEEKVLQDMLEEGGNEEKLGVERGTNVSSLDDANKVSTLFVKMLPQVERVGRKTKLYREQDIDVKQKHLYYRVGEDLYVKIKLNEFGKPVLVDYTPTWNKIALALADKMTLQEMLIYIDNNPQLVKSIPEIFIFRQRLSKPIENEFDFILHSNIETAFKKVRVGVFVGLNNKGTVSFINEGTDISRQSRDLLNSGLLSVLQDSLSKYYDEENGLFLVGKWLKDKNLVQGDDVNIEYIEANDILSELGVELDPETIESNGVRTVEYLNFVKNFISFLSNFESVPINLADFIIKDQTVNGVKVQGISNFFKKLFEKEHSINPLSITTMVYNAEGELQSILSVPNTLLQTKIHYNQSQTIEELQQRVPRTKNDMFEHSLTRQLLFPTFVELDGSSYTKRSNINVLVDLLSGWKIVKEGRKSEGKLTVSLDYGDWVRLNFVGMLKQGAIENTRAETATTSYTFRMSSWDTGFHKQTPFSFAQAQSAWKTESKTINLTNNSQITQVWLGYFKGELTRIKKQNLEKGFALFKNILTESEQKQILVHLQNNSVDSTFEQFSNSIIPSLNNFFKSELEDFQAAFEKDMGGIDSIIGTLKDGKRSGDQVIFNQIYPEGKDLLTEYQVFFILNYLTLHVEETILFQGDLSQMPKYFKRAKGIQSTGTPVSTNPLLLEEHNRFLDTFSLGRMFGFPLTIGETYDSATIKDDKRPSVYYDRLVEGYIQSKKEFNKLSNIEQSDDDIKEEAEEALADYKEGVNIGDGGGFTNPDFYISILRLVGNCSIEQLRGHQALMLDAKKNAVKYFGQDLVNEYGIVTQLTNEEEALLEEGMKYIEQGKAILPILKVTQRGNIIGEDVVQKEIMDKFALFPMYPQFVYDKPVAKEALIQMIVGGLGYIKFESGTKIDSNGATDFIRRIESGELGVTFEDSRHTVKTEMLREQIKTPTKAKTKSTFSTQFRKLINAIKDKVLKQRWVKLNQQLSLEIKQQVLSSLGIVQTERGWDFSNVDKVKLINTVLREAKRKDVPTNLVSYLEKYKKGKLTDIEILDAYELLEASFGSQKIQNIFANIIKNISIQKLKGAQLVQAPQSLFDRQIKVEGKTRELGFYHFKDGEPQAAECKIAMQGDFRNLLNLPEVEAYLEQKGLEDTEMNRIEGLNFFLQRDNFIEKYKQALTVIGYRIPDQGFNSMEVMVIREFLPRFYGNTIVCPPEITTQSGADYDYDKLSVIFPSLNKDGSVKGNTLDKMIETARDILLSKEVFFKLVLPNTNALIFDFIKGKGEKKGLLEKIGKSTEDPKFTRVISFKGNSDKFKAVKGKDLLGIAAVWNTFTTLIQNHEVSLNPEFNKTVGRKQVSIRINPILGSLRSFEPNTQNGTPKSEVISQLINVTVDMPSDDAFGQTNLDMSDFGAFIYAISMLGYDFETTMLLFHQPIIFRYKQLFNRNLKKGASLNRAGLLAMSEILGIPIPSGTRGPDFSKFERELYEELDEMELELNPSKFDVGIDRVSGFETIDYGRSEKQRAVLAHYYKLLIQARAFKKVQSALNFDTNPDSGLAKVYKRLFDKNEAIASQIISTEKLISIEKDSVISGLHVSDILLNLNKELFPVLFSVNNLKEFGFAAEKYSELKEKAYQKLVNNFLLSIVQNFGTFNKRNIYDVAEEFLTGDKKNRIIKFVKKNKNKYNYRLLRSIVTNVSKKRQPVIFNTQIYLGLENSPEDKNTITEEWREILNSEDKDLSNFGKALAVVGLVQSGWQNSPIYFSDLIPEEFITPIISEAINIYRQLSPQQQERYAENFIRNFHFYEEKTLGAAKGFEESYRLADYRKGTEAALALPDNEVDEDVEDIFTPFEEVTEQSQPKTYKGQITKLEPNQIFVFGSNTEGRHGKGAALIAKEKFGAKYGQAEGLQGQSYAIITKDLTKSQHPSRTKEQIQEQISKLYSFANDNKDKEFLIAYSGEGKNLNAYSPQEMADMFSAFPIPNNIIFEQEFNRLITRTQLKDDFLDFVETLSQPKTQDEFKYYGAMYTIELKNGKAVDVVNLQKGQNETGVKFQERKNKIINAYNTNPDVDPQNGKPFRTSGVSDLDIIESVNPKVLETKEPEPQYYYEFKDGYRVPTSFILNEEQREALSELENFINSKDSTITLSGAAGCLGYGTKVLMFDGTYKEVQDIVVGDQLMGIDSKPRNVLELKRGVEQMYIIHQNKGISYRVNQSHILSLKQVKPRKFKRKTESGKRKSSEEILKEKEVITINISVLDYLNSNKSFIKHTKGYISNLIEFNTKEISIDPYYLGLWLGDGNKADIRRITCADQRIIDYVMSIGGVKKTKYGYTIYKENLTNDFKKLYGLTNGSKLEEKYIPDIYLFNNSEIRFLLLAGLIDSDGSYNIKGKYYEITQKNKKIAEQIVFLCRSLGFRTQMKEKKAFIGKKDCGVVYRITFSANVDIPVLLERKRNTKLSNFKDRRHTGIKIEKDVVDNYYGFVLDGDHLFLLEDFTVTHNTGKTTILTIFNKWLENKKYIYPKYSSPTHRANAVSKLMNPGINVYTLHQLFGLSPDVDLIEGNYDVKDLEFSQNNPEKIGAGDILIIDESSMISDSLYEFIKKEQEEKEVRVIYVGDVAQLKPVKQKDKSKVFTSEAHKVLKLTKVERTGDNAILKESVAIREGKDLSYETSLNDKGEGVIYVGNRPEMLQIAEREFTTQSQIENKLYFRILSATNNAVAEVNKLVRKVLYKEDSENQLVAGEILMGYDNFDYNFKIGQYKLYNGGDYEVVSIKPATKTIHSLNLTFTGYNVVVQNLLDRKEKPYSLFIVDNNESDEKAIKVAEAIQDLNKKGAALKRIGNTREAAQFFSMATELKSSVAFMRDITKFDPVTNTTKTIYKRVFDYGYAHTIHKSQGGTYDNVMILADTVESFKDRVSQQELKYVAVSRARKVAYIRTNHALKQEQTQTEQVIRGENLWSGSSDPFAAALTNPTTIAKRKGKINKEYPVVFKGKTYEDAESAYKSNKTNDLELAKQGKIDPRNNKLMIEILIAKLSQYPELVKELTNRGGVQWLEQSEHTVNGNRFEGKGRNSPFIQNLISAYEQVTSNKQTDNELIREYIDNVSTGKITPDWMKLKRGQSINFDAFRNAQSISGLVTSIKSKISQLSEKIEQLEKEGADQKVIDSLSVTVQAYGSLVYDLENLKNEDKSHSILKFEKIPTGSVTLGQFQVRDSEFSKSSRYDRGVASSNMSGSSIRQILQSGDSSRIKSYRIANYLLDTLYVSEGWQNSIVQDLADRGVVVKTHLLTDDSETSSFMSQQKNIITINVRAIERFIENENVDGFDQFLKDSLDEELIHLLTVSLATEEEIKEIAKELSEKDKQRITDYYFSRTNEKGSTLSDRNIAMEYIRMVVQQKLFGKTTEDSKQEVLGIVPTMRKLLNKILNYIVNLFERNPQSVSTKLINNIIDVIKKESLENHILRLENLKKTNQPESRFDQEPPQNCIGI